MKTKRDELARKILNEVYTGNNNCFLFGNALDIADFILADRAAQTNQLLDRIEQAMPLAEKYRSEGFNTAITYIEGIIRRAREGKL